MKKIILYLALTFIISWSSFLILKETNTESLTFYLVTALWYMPGPAIATLIMERFKRGGLLSYFNLKKIDYRWFLIAPLIAVIFNSLVFLLIYLFGEIMSFEGFGNLIFSKEEIIENLADKGLIANFGNVKIPENTFILLIIISLFGSTIGGLINLPFTLGEELGWRGYLLRNIKSNFFVKNILIGMIWGIWHMPIIFLGYNFESNFILGSLLMIVFCIVATFVFSFLRYRSNTVLAPAFLHGSINATAPIILLYLKGGRDLFWSPVGISGILAMLILSIVLHSCFGVFKTSTSITPVNQLFP